ncbi:hypothetical protein D3C71_1648000 [compost metagenome]
MTVCGVFSIARRSPEAASTSTTSKIRVDDMQMTHRRRETRGRNSPSSDQLNVNSTTWTTTFRFANKVIKKLLTPTRREHTTTARLARLKGLQMYGSYPLTKASPPMPHWKITVYSQPCPHTQS